MRPFGLPLWAIVLVLCVIAPTLVRMWVDAEERRAKERTRSLLQRLGWGKDADPPGTRPAAKDERTSKR